MLKMSSVHRFSHNHYWSLPPPNSLLSCRLMRLLRLGREASCRLSCPSTASSWTVGTMLATLPAAAAAAAASMALLLPGRPNRDRPLGAGLLPAAPAAAAALEGSLRRLTAGLPGACTAEVVAGADCPAAATGLENICVRRIRRR